LYNTTKRLKRTQPYLPYSDIVSEVKRMDFSLLSQTELKEAVNNYRQKMTSFDPRRQLELFGLIKEIIYRLTGLLLFDTQIAASASIVKGNLAELPTGEGKTLAAVIPALIHALQGLRVHVLTFNDYLAERDLMITRNIYEFCGVSVGFINQNMPRVERLKIYQKDILYLTVKEAGFDYLKNFLCSDEREFFPISFDYAIVDEADSILIDEAANPLVLACNHQNNYEMIERISRAVSILEERDYSVKKEENQAYLTERGIWQIEEFLSLDNLYDEHNIELLSMVNMALQAHFLLKRDLDYIVQDDKVRIVDRNTGRIAVSKKYPDLLHASVEAKEKLPLSNSSMIYNMITIQNFILQYRKLSGMTGTATASKNEFYQVYGLEVDVIPPHIPSRRLDYEPLVYPTKKEKYRGITEAVLSAHARSQPVLVGTQSVEESEILSETLREMEIPHQVLNAKNDREEAALIAEAGNLSTVTVSTNMAGRGVDIKLGGANEKDRETVLKKGGLLVIGTGLNRSSRIDLQLCGRTGRQGDKGESRFYISLEDDLFEESKWILPSIANALEEKQWTQAIKMAGRSQRHAEGIDEASRLILSRYSYILEHQRKIITHLRNQILFSMSGEEGVSLAKKQLTLYYINQHWAEYLESMEYVRDGIHLTIIGGLDPLDEYHKMAVSAFEEMKKNVDADVALGLNTFEITKNGIDMNAAGLGNASTTWTYLIDESKSQFSSLPRLIGEISNNKKGALFSIRKIANIKKFLTRKQK